MRAKEREHLGNVANYQNRIIDTLVPKLVESLNGEMKARAYDFAYDLNEIIKDSKESLFTNHWIHCNARGNEICAEYVYKILQQRGILN